MYWSFLPCWFFLAQGSLSIRSAWSDVRLRSATSNDMYEFGPEDITYLSWPRVLGFILGPINGS